MEDEIILTKKPSSYQASSFKLKRNSSLSTDQLIIQSFNDNNDFRKSINIDDLIRIECPINNYAEVNEKIIIKNCDNSLDKSVTILVESGAFSSMLNTIIQICNCIIRYTVLQIPFCYLYLGIFNASLLIMIVALISIGSLYLLLKAHEATGDR